MSDKTADVDPVAQRLNDEMLEALDEELELELMMTGSTPL
jgi:hypothetical protein